MADTERKLRSQLNIPAGDDERIHDCLRTASQYVASAIGDETVSEDIRDDCIVACAADLYNSKAAQLGIMDTSMDGVQPYRIPLDPLRSVWPKLNAAGVLTGGNVIA